MTDTTTTQAQHAEENAVAGNNVLSLEEADKVHEAINLLEHEYQILQNLLERYLRDLLKLTGISGLIHSPHNDSTMTLADAVGTGERISLMNLPLGAAVREARAILPCTKPDTPADTAS